MTEYLIVNASLSLYFTKKQISKSWIIFFKGVYYEAINIKNIHFDRIDLCGITLWNPSVCK